MKVIRVYEYAKCSTCVKAIKFLTNARYALERVDIFTSPPSRAEIEKMIDLEGGNFRKVFNSAGHVYKDMGLAEKLKTATREQAVDLLASNGRLIKRPFILFEDKGVVGFDPEHWKKVFGR